MTLFTSDLLIPAMHDVPVRRARMRYGAPAYGCRSARLAAPRAPRLVALPEPALLPGKMDTPHVLVEYDRAA